MTKIGSWYLIRFENGKSLNTQAMSEEEARKKAPNYVDSPIVSITLVGGITKKNDDIQSF